MIVLFTYSQDIKHYFVLYLYLYHIISLSFRVQENPAIHIMRIIIAAKYLTEVNR